MKKIVTALAVLLAMFPLAATAQRITLPLPTRGPAAARPECAKTREGNVYITTNASSRGDCSSAGGGSTAAECRCSSLSWVPVARGWRVEDMSTSCTTTTDVIAPNGSGGLQCTAGGGGGLSFPVTLTPVTGGGPWTIETTGSTVTGATNEGLRKAAFTLFDTNTSSDDSALVMMDCIQRTHTGTIKRSCLHVKSYTEPDNGGDVSGILVASSGGGPGVTIYKHSGLRPAGFTDYSSSTQPALEVGSGDEGPAIIASAGVDAWGTPDRNHAIEARMAQPTGSNQSDGIVIWPTNNVFDSRLALVVGSPQGNAAPTNTTVKIEADGDTTLTNSTNQWAWAGATGTTLTNATNDGSSPAISFMKSRGGASVNTNDVISVIGSNFLNSAAATKQGSSWQTIASDKTSGTEDVDITLYLIRTGTLSPAATFTSLGGLNLAGALAASNVTGTNTGDQVVPANTTSTASQWFSAYNSTTGAFTKSQPAFTDISGTASAAQTPLAVLLAGRAGGQTINGDTASGGALTLVSTAHATKGFTYIRDSGAFSFDEVNERFGINVAAPSFPLDVQSAADAANQVNVQNTNGSGTSALARVRSQADAAILDINAHGSGRTATRFGITIGGWADIVASTGGNGLLIGTTINKPTVIGTNDVERLRITETGHLTMKANAPSVSCTGTGTSPSAPTVVGVDNAFTVTVNTGTGTPGNTGTCTVTYTATTTNTSPTVCMLVSGATAWGNNATIRQTTESATAPVFTWFNHVNGALTALTVSTSYKFSCVMMGRS